ncbi:hypothetical protein FQZ97_1192430 [compost metagenome]
MVDGQIAHGLEHVAQLSLERELDQRGRLQPEERVLDHVFGAGMAAGDTSGDLHHHRAVVDEGLQGSGGGVTGGKAVNSSLFWHWIHLCASGGAFFDLGVRRWHKLVRTMRTVK